MPYFLTNKSWYKRVIKNDIPCIVLTDKAPQKAIDSYNDYMKMLKKGR